METAVCKGPVDARAAAGMPAGIMPAGSMIMLPGGVMTRLTGTVPFSTLTLTPAPLPWLPWPHTSSRTSC